MYKLDFASGVCLCAIIIATFLISSSLWSIMNDGLLALRFQWDRTAIPGSICGTQIDPEMLEILKTAYWWKCT